MLKQKMKMHKNNFSRRLRVDLTITLLASWVVITLCSSLLFYQYAFNVVRQQAEKDRHVMLSQLEYNLTNYTRQMEQNTQQLTLLDSAARLMSGQLTDDVDIYLRSKAVFTQVEGWFQNFDAASVYYYSVSGTAIGVSPTSHRIQLHDPQAAQLAEKYLEQLAQAQKSVMWLGHLSAKDDFFYNGGDDTPYVSLLRVNNMQGKSASVILINISEENFRNIYNQANGERYSRYVVDENGSVVSGEALPFDTGEGTVAQARQPLNGMGWMLVDEYQLDALGQEAAHLLPYMGSLLVVALLAAILVSVGWINKFTRPLAKLKDATFQLEKGDLGATLDPQTTHELGALGRQFNAMSEGILRLMKQKEQVEEERRTYQIAALRAQINPHFLYNTLNNIRWISMIAKTENITECISALRDILYFIFRHEGDDCTLKEELDYVKNFLTIMNYRFGRTIHTRMEVEEGLESTRMIRFVLQPILENSIMHGNRQNGIPLEILLHAYRENGNLVIDVVDDGKGIAPDKLEELNAMLAQVDARADGIPQGRSIGIVNVHKRIRLCCGLSYGLRIASGNGETRIKLIMPLR